MGTKGRKTHRPGLLAGLALAAGLLALPAGPARAEGTEAPGARGELPASSAPSANARAAETGNAAGAKAQPDLVAEKFRKLQEEMSRADGGASAVAGAAASEPKSASEPIGVVSLALQIVVGLAFVLLLAVVSIRTLKRFQGRLFSRPGSAAGGDILEVLETCHLGTHQRVVAMRINDEVGVLGVTQQGISILTVLKQPAEDIRRQRLGAGNSAAFSDNLNRLLDRFKKPKRVSDLLDEA